jgi:hypothetical protein
MAARDAITVGRACPIAIRIRPWLEKDLSSLVMARLVRAIYRGRCG